MWIQVLGASAGGGLPQWNCRCRNCVLARSGSSDVRPRTQSSVAVSADRGAWYLLNVSADVRQQLSSLPSLWPPEGYRRGTPIAGCVLTDAEIDHASGLLQLREGCSFGIFTTETIRRWLEQYLPIKTVLDQFADRSWTEIPLDRFVELPLPDGSSSGLRLRAFEVGRDVPRYVPEDPEQAVGSVIGLQIEDVRTGGRLVYAPGVSGINDALNRVVDGADALLLDGTFWTDDEPIRAGISDQRALQMGHVPVDGPEGSLRWLAELPVRHRMYVHVNNTNPMLDERGEESEKVRRHGVVVANDGDVLEV